MHVPELESSPGDEPPVAERPGVAERTPAAESPPVGEEFSAAEVIAAEPVAPQAVTVPAGAVNVVPTPHPHPHLVVSPALELHDEDEDDQVLDRKPREEPELDMTPMVDVTFLLLIFFMVTAAFSLQKSIEMPRQQTDAPSSAVIEKEEDELDMVEVQVDEFGGFLVLATDWERETPGKQNLITALKEAIAGAPDGMRLIIKVHELAKLRALVDAMDAGTIAGYKELQVTQVEEFD